MARWVLTIAGGRSIDLLDTPMTVGRDACDVVLDDMHRSVSRCHARLEPEADGVRVTDLGSTNGTALNGAPITGTAIARHGDRLTFGRVTVLLTDADAQPNLVGRYEIVREIGRGGMGVVYEARDTRLARRVALKVLPADLAFNAELAERFLREGRLAASIAHPNVVTVYDAEEADGMSFLAMELVEGSDLAHLIRGQPALDLSTALPLLEQVAAGLDSAHALGIVHRDIKPENVLINSDGVAKVTDFGIARFGGFGGSTLTAVTQTGAILGTVSYMSPEQARGLPVTNRSDIYSLACVAFEMLTGEAPFGRPTGTQDPVSILVRHITEPAPLAHALNPRLNAQTGAALARGLEKEPDRRPKSASEFVRTLAVNGMSAQPPESVPQPFGPQHGLAAATSAPTPPAAPVPTTSVPYTQMTVAVSFAIVAIVAIVATLVGVLQWQTATADRDRAMVTSRDAIVRGEGAKSVNSSHRDDPHDVALRLMRDEENRLQASGAMMTAHREVRLRLVRGRVAASREELDSAYADYPHNDQMRKYSIMAGESESAARDVRGLSLEPSRKETLVRYFEAQADRYREIRDCLSHERDFGYTSAESLWDAQRKGSYVRAEQLRKQAYALLN